MTQVIEIPLSKIVQDKDIYPRFQVDPDRINLFSELLECETKFPPLKVVKENGSYVLLDGFHRMEAYKRTGRCSVETELWDVSRCHARMASARFNNNSSKPLSAGELQQVIIDAYQKDGIKNTDEIAREVACSERYVRKTLQPIRDKERKELETKVKKLMNDGSSQREIAKKVGVSQSNIYDMEKKIRLTGNGTVPFPVSAENSGLPNGEPVNKNAAPSVATDTEKHQAPAVATGDEGSGALNLGGIGQNKSVEYGTAPFLAPPKNSDVQSGEPVNKTTDPETGPAVVETDTVVKSGMSPISASPQENQQRKRQSPTVAKGVVASVVYNEKEPTQSQKNTLVSLELIKQDNSTKKIAHKLGQPETWVRNSGLTLMALYYNDGDEPVEVVADTKLYNIDRERVMYVNHLSECQPEILPSRSEVYAWLDKNKPTYRDVMFNDVFSDEKMFGIRHGKKSFENKTESVPEGWAKIPDNITDGFEQGIRLIEKVTEMVKQDVVQDKDVIWKLTAFYNRLIVAQNEFKDAVCEMRDRILTQEEC